MLTTTETGARWRRPEDTTSNGVPIAPRFIPQTTDDKSTPSTLDESPQARRRHRSFYTSHSASPSPLLRSPVGDTTNDEQPPRRKRSSKSAHYLVGYVKRTRPVSDDDALINRCDPPPREKRHRRRIRTQEDSLRQSDSTSPTGGKHRWPSSAERWYRRAHATGGSNPVFSQTTETTDPAALYQAGQWLLDYAERTGDIAYYDQAFARFMDFHLADSAYSSSWGFLAAGRTMLQKARCLHTQLDDIEAEEHSINNALFFLSAGFAALPYKKQFDEIESVAWLLCNYASMLASNFPYAALSVLFVFVSYCDHAQETNGEDIERHPDLIGFWAKALFDLAQMRSQMDSESAEAKALLVAAQSKFHLAIRLCGIWVNHWNHCLQNARPEDYQALHERIHRFHEFHAEYQQHLRHIEFLIMTMEKDQGGTFHHFHPQEHPVDRNSCPPIENGDLESARKQKSQRLYLESQEGISTPSSEELCSVSPTEEDDSSGRISPVLEQYAQQQYHQAAGYVKSLNQMQASPESPVIDPRLLQDCAVETRADARVSPLGVHARRATTDASMEQNLEVEWVGQRTPPQWESAYVNTPESTPRAGRTISNEGSITLHQTG